MIRYEPFFILGRSHAFHTPDSLTLDYQLTWPCRDYWPLHNCVS